MQDYSKKSQYILGIVGCGNMGEAMLRGILETSFLFPREITFFDSDTARSGFISQKYGIFFSADIDSLVKESRYILIAVKPQNIPEVLIELGKSFDPGYNKVISIAAGVSTYIFEKSLGNSSSIVRIMPNTPALVNKGISAISRGRSVSDDDFEFAVGMISSLGDYIAIDEDMQNRVTAISGSGPAYFFLFCKYLIESAVENGIDKKIAEKLVIKTMAGAAEMLEKISLDTDCLIDMVASRGGTTEKAILEFKTKDIRSIIFSAVSSATKRAEEIQEEIEKL